MINKFYKIINNKFFRLSKLIFFLSFLLIIFLISLSIFLSIPKLFDYQSKKQIIKSYVSQTYGLTIDEIENIKYNSLPKPHLEIRNAKANLDLNKNYIKIHTLKIYPKIINIYNFRNFEANKIAIINSDLVSNSQNFQILNKIFFLKKKLTFKNLNIQFNKDNITVIKFKEINYSNYGLKKNLIEGKIFSRKFKIKLKNNYRNIEFKLFNTGVVFYINLLEKIEKDHWKGNFKAKILDSNLKLNFNYIDNILFIKDSFFRSKNLSLNSDGTIKIKPFFLINLNSNLNNINSEIINFIDINKILEAKNLFKKLSMKNKIIYKSKKIRNKIIESFNLDSTLAYGRLVFVKDISISKGQIKCNNNLNLIEEFPILNFKCFVKSNDKKGFLKNFKISNNKNNTPFSLNIEGNLNILKKKINFNMIETDANYKASEEDLKFLKMSFEKNIFDQEFSKIFNRDKFKKFILEIL